MIIDLFDFTRQAATASGEIALSRLARIDTPDREGRLAWRAHGSMTGRHGAARLDLTVDGAVPLICQRCLQPMAQPVAVASRFLVAHDETSAEALDQDDDYDVIVGSTAFDLDALIEDELILALPSAPRHRVCPTIGEASADAHTNRRPSPFAALAALRTGTEPGDRSDDGSDGT